MKFPTLALFALASATLGQAVSLSYDPVYDNGGQSLNTVACSDGNNGLLSKGFTTFGSLPRFPRIGGAPAVTGWNSPACGTCWELSYNNRKINIIAIDVGSAGFNIAKGAMDELTGGRAAELGRIDVSSRQVSPSSCGL